MPELLLLRHGKSDWDAEYLRDRDRPLAGRGRLAAETVGRVLTRMGKQPDLVVTSPARRARLTAELAAAAGGWAAPIAEHESFYGAPPELVVGALAGTSEQVSRLMIVGHEPVWSATVSLLVGGGSVRMVTGAVAAVEVPEWSLVEPGSGRLLWMLTPRLFTDGDLDL